MTLAHAGGAAGRPSGARRQTVLDASWTAVYPLRPCRTRWRALGALGLACAIVAFAWAVSR
ncbi:MAG: hypothetical protein H6825_16715 [Planctomycetes bacterium]|nr:hypothetical protein [Planctomycetota bacterium]